MTRLARRETAWLLLGIGAATAAAHIGNNFTTYLIGGLIDLHGFSPLQIGVWAMVETLSYAAAMFLVAPKVASLSPRLLIVIAGALIVLAQLAAGVTGSYPLLLLTRLASGLGFGLANTAVNLAAGRTTHPARAISLGITVQTILYAGVNIGLPIVGQRFGVAGMFFALAILSAILVLAATWLPSGRTLEERQQVQQSARPLGADDWRVLTAMALFTFGSLAIWPFMERAAHSIGISAVLFGRFQSVATLASALGNLILALLVARLRRSIPLAAALLACGLACAALTTIANQAVFALALIVYNVSWFVTYPLLLGIAFAIDARGRLAVLCSAVWLLMMSLGSLATGIIAQVLGGYQPAGIMGLVFCLAAAGVAWPLARRLDGDRSSLLMASIPSTAG